MLTVALLLAAACGGGNTTVGSGGGGGSGELAMAASDADRVRPPLDADDSAIQDLVDGDTAFALDLYRDLVADDPDANLFLSPYSISVALAMTLPGARGDTFDQLAAALRADDDEAWHEARNALDRLLVEREHGDDEELDLRIANSLFAQDGYPFDDEFLDLLGRQYGAGMQLVDFQGSPEPSRQAINDWVADQTEDLIEELLAAGTITPATRLVLANAIYFHANWVNQFSEDRTTETDFATAAGASVTVDMMRTEFETEIGQGDRWAAARLPYEGGASMLVILPDEGRFEEFANGLDAGTLDTIRSELDWGDLRIRMPRFEIDTRFSLVEPLARLGVVDLFEPPTPAGGADLTGMTADRELFVSEVAHQAVVTVDEEGTEAAAATAVVVADEAAPPAPEHTLQLVLDRSFVFLIQDDATGAILFLGQVTDPTVPR